MSIAELNSRLTRIAEQYWFHNAVVNERREISVADALQHRVYLLKEIFGSALFDKSLLVVNEHSGMYSTMAMDCGVREVIVNNPSADDCAFISEVHRFMEVSAKTLCGSLIRLKGGQIFVDTTRRASVDFVMCQGFSWTLYQSAGNSFADMVAAACFYARLGVLFDWDCADWTTPPPPDDYSLDNFRQALKNHCERVDIIGNTWVLAQNSRAPSPSCMVSNPRVEQSKLSDIRGFYRRPDSTVRARKRIRVAIVENDLQVGGAEWWSAQLAGRIDPGRFEVFFICYNLVEAPLAGYLEAGGIRLYSSKDFFTTLPAYCDWVDRYLFDCLREAGPDVLLFPTQLLFTQLAGHKLADFKKVVRISNYDPGQFDHYELEAADRIICCSKEQHDHAVRRWNEKSVLIRSGVDLVQFQPDCNERARLNRELDIGAKKVVLFVGRLWDVRKQLSFFQQVVCNIKRYRDDVVFLAVGYFLPQYGDDAKVFREFVSANPVIWIDDAMPWEIQRFFQVSDVLISTSSSEGLSNTVLQALAAGVIPVTTKSPGMTDLVASGENGFIVDSDDPRRFSDVLSMVLDLSEAERKTLRNAGRRLAVEEFDINRSTGKVQDLLSALIESEADTEHRPQRRDHERCDRFMT